MDLRLDICFIIGLVGEALKVCPKTLILMRWEGAGMRGKPKTYFKESKVHKINYKNIIGGRVVMLLPPTPFITNWLHLFKLQNVTILFILLVSSISYFVSFPPSLIYFSSNNSWFNTLRYLFSSQCPMSLVYVQSPFPLDFC